MTAGQPAPSLRPITMRSHSAPSPAWEAFAWGAPADPKAAGPNAGTPVVPILLDADLQPFDTRPLAADSIERADGAVFLVAPATATPCPDILERIRAALSARPDVGVFYGDDAVVDAEGLARADRSLPEADMPIHVPQLRHMRPPLDAPAAGDGSPETGKSDDKASDGLAGAVQRAVEHWLSKAGLGGASDAPGKVYVEQAEGGDMLIEIVSEMELDDALDLELEFDVDDNGEGGEGFPDAARLTEALRAAGYDVHTMKDREEKAGGGKKEKKSRRK